jgi:retron-type reverse transcriptase
VKKYFPSIDHEILYGKIKHKIACPSTLRLIKHIIDSGQALKNNLNEPEHFFGDDLFTPLTRCTGIPIGNLTSQFFANVYLNDFDHFIKEELLCRYYIRYVDDFVICHDSKSFLHELKTKIIHRLEKDRLSVHKDKCQVIKVDAGIDFLGYRIFPTHRLVRKSNVRRYKRKLRNMRQRYANAELEFKEITQRVMSWMGHIRWADSFHLRQQIFKDLVFQRTVHK